MKDFLLDTPVPESVHGLELEDCHFSNRPLVEQLRGWAGTASTPEVMRLKLGSSSSLPPLFFSGLVRLKSLDISRNGLQVLAPSQLQQALSLETLYLELNNLTEITQEALSNCSSLRLINLSGNLIETIHPASFADLRNLSDLYLNKNRLTALPENLFSGNPHLTLLDLSHNKIQGIRGALFEQTTNILHLDLSENYLTDLPATIFRSLKKVVILKLSGNPSPIAEDQFAGLDNLKELYLSKCNLTTIPKNLFRNLTSLRTLHLNENHLTTLGPGIFEGMSSLRQLHLQLNNLSRILQDTMAPLPQLEELDLSGNSISFNEEMQTTEIEPISPLNKLRNLRRINLSNNHITKLGYFDWQSFNNLTSLVLANNTITEITFIDLRFHSNHLEINLRNNPLTVIDFNYAALLDQEQGLRTNKRLLVSSSQLSCDCLTLPLIQYLNRTLPSDNVAYSWTIDASGLTCLEPPPLAQQNLKRVDPLQFMCPCDWALGEPLDLDQPCDCRIRPHDKRTLIDCRSRNLTSAPENLPQFPDYGLELDMSSNRLNETSALKSSAYGSLTLLDLSDNGLTSEFLDNFQWWSDDFLPRLTTLRLTGNQLESVSDKTLDKWRSSSKVGRVKVNMSSNPWQCDCDPLTPWFYEFREIITDYRNMNCSKSEHCYVAPAAILSLSWSLKAAALIVPLAVILVLCLVVLLVVNRHSLRAWMYSRGWCLAWIAKMDEHEDRQRPYDAFVSYSHLDDEFVLNELVPRLEGDAGYRLCLHHRDWLAGEWIPHSILRSVAASKRTIIILSDNFVDSFWGQLEFRTAYEQLAVDQRVRLIIVVKSELSPASYDKMNHVLRNYLSLNTYLKQGDPWFWSRLKYALPHKKLVGQEVQEAPLERVDGKQSGQGLAPLPLAPARD